MNTTTKHNISDNRFAFYIFNDKIYNYDEVLFFSLFQRL